MKLYAAVAALLAAGAVSATADDAPRAGALAVYYSGPVLDLAMTEYGLARGMGEGNPLMQHRAVRFGWRLGVASALAAYDRRELRRGRNPRRLRIAWIATNAVIVGWNVHKLATREGGR